MRPCRANEREGEGRGRHTARTSPAVESRSRRPTNQVAGRIGRGGLPRGCWLSTPWLGSAARSAGRTHLAAPAEHGLVKSSGSTRRRCRRQRRAAGGTCTCCCWRPPPLLPLSVSQCPRGASAEVQGTKSTAQTAAVPAVFLWKTARLIEREHDREVGRRVPRRITHCRVIIDTVEEVCQTYRMRDGDIL